MKASAMVFQTVQYPQTLFGLPPTFVLLTIAVMGVLTFICLVTVSGLVSLLIFLGGTSLTCSYFWTMRSKEPHCETLLFLPTTRLGRNKSKSGKRYGGCASRLIVAGGAEHLESGQARRRGKRKRGRMSRSLRGRPS